MQPTRSLRTSSTLSTALALLAVASTGCERAPKHYEPATITSSAQITEVGGNGAPPAAIPPDHAEADDRVAGARATMKGTEGHDGVSGTVAMSEPKAGSVIVAVELGGLAPGSVHGFHIHEKGDCSAPDATSAGGHFAPRDHDHGLPPTTRHAGDMGNVTADEEGKVETTITLDTVSVRDGEPASVVGRAVVLHQKADDGKGDSGHAGARIACGVIERS